MLGYFRSTSSQVLVNCFLYLQLLLHVCIIMNYAIICLKDLPMSHALCHFDCYCIVFATCTVCTARAYNYTAISDALTLLFQSQAIIISLGLQAF